MILTISIEICIKCFVVVWCYTRYSLRNVHTRGSVALMPSLTSIMAYSVSLTISDLSWLVRVTFKRKYLTLYQSRKKET